MVYPEATALRRFSARLNALLKAEDAQQQKKSVQQMQRQQMHSYNLRPRPATTCSVAVGPYNLRPRRQVCYVE